MINFVQTRHETKDAFAIYKRYRSKLRVGVISIFGRFIVKTYPPVSYEYARRKEKSSPPNIDANSGPRVLNIEGATIV